MKESKTRAAAGRPGWIERHYLALFLAPSLILLIAFAGYITISLIYLSLCNWNVSNPTPVFAGVGNYISIFRDMSFWKSLGRTCVYLICTVTGEVVTGFIAAYLFNREMRGIRILRTLILIPMAITPVVAGMFWKVMYNTSYGPINYFLSLVGIQGPAWIASSRTAFFSVLIVNIWQWMPFSFLTITAGLASLPTDVYEAARIDGASSRQILFQVTIPMMKQVLLTLVLLRSIEALKAYDLVYIMTSGGPGEATQLLPFYIYTKGFTWFDFGSAAAMSLILLVIANNLFKLFINKTGVKVFYE